MIEVNLVRQIQSKTDNFGSSTWGQGLIGVLLVLMIGIASWWWTDRQQQELHTLLNEKDVQSQSFMKIQARLRRLEQYHEEKQTLTTALEKLHAQQIGKTQPVLLLDGVSQSIDGLDIWLDSLQLIDQRVELKGQTYSLQDIGTYINTLEHERVVISLPTVEIFDQEDRGGEKVFSFVIRFDVGELVPA